MIVDCYRMAGLVEVDGRVGVTVANHVGFDERMELNVCMTLT